MEDEARLSAFLHGSTNDPLPLDLKGKSAVGNEKRGDENVSEGKGGKEERRVLKGEKRRESSGKKIGSLQSTRFLN